MRAISAEPFICPINNAYCKPRPCENCKRIFCAHQHPELRSFGYYGQYCSPECRDAKAEQMMVLGRTRWECSRIVLIVEQEYCYLVINRKNKEKPGYGFKILHEEANSRGDGLNLDYCHYPGFSVEDHPVTYAMHPQLQVAIAVYDERDRSMWTIIGFRVLDGEVDTYGVGGHIEVIDLRKEETDESD